MLGFRWYNQAMKIAIFDNVPPGGAARVAHEQAAYLAACGHQVMWFSGNHASKASVPAAVTRVHHHLSRGYVLNQTILTRSVWLTHHLKQAYQRIYERIMVHAPDIMVVHPCRFTQAPYLLSLSTIPTVYFIEEPLRVVSEPELHSLQHLQLFSRMAATVERKILKKIDQKNTSTATHRLTHSEFCAATIRRYYNLQVSPLGLGVDGSIFKKTVKTNVTNPYFLFVGEKNELNGYAFLQKAILRKHMRVTYISPEHGKLSLSDNQLAKLYSGATATLCLARKEPFGLVALESMACSTPVIALSEGGYKETVLAEKTGLLVKRQPQSLLQAMERVLDPSYQGHLAKQCRPHVLKHFSWQSHGQRLEAILESVVQQAGVGLGRTA